MTTVRILTAALMCSALALSACQKKAETPPADAAAPAAADAAADASATVTPTAGTPAECQAYLDHVNACTTKLASSNAMVAEQMRKSMETTKASWATITDQAALGAACKQADDAYMSSASAMGC
jgi:hypothetical protein